MLFAALILIPVISLDEYTFLHCILFEQVKLVTVAESQFNLSIVKLLVSKLAIDAYPA
jgi:hypothetical protein